MTLLKEELDPQSLYDRISGTFWQKCGNAAPEALEVSQYGTRLRLSIYGLEDKLKHGPWECQLQQPAPSMRASEIVVRTDRHQRWDHYAWVYINAEDELVMSQGLEVRTFRQISRDTFVSLLVDRWFGVKSFRGTP
ncbi:MAG TPA: hypothetical protein DCE41_36930 [Cytophagales bacterium]|nr:hypothetical protein [Cytophagales bacterium]HAA21155.1 hypothetical protein [Cytophagales bacterium]HAP60676.1 hypothetical protein [Cytophagales bacterium]